jgi:hypothetical protein
MARPRVFEIIFENSLGIFRNGQTMNGVVLIENDYMLDLDGKLHVTCYNYNTTTHYNKQLRLYTYVVIL